MPPSNALIPFLDLVTPHVEMDEERLSVFRGALRSGGFVGGAAVENFERMFAEFCDVRHAAGVASGTDALLFALLAAGVKPGDTVVTVPNTFIATTEAIRQAGARPDFVDIDERSYTMDAVKLLRYLETECTRGRNAQVVSTEPTVCLALATWDFEAVVGEQPKVALAILRELAGRLRESTEAHRH